MTFFIFPNDILPDTTKDRGNDCKKLGNEI